MTREREEWMLVNTEPEGKGNIRDNRMEVLGKVLAGWEHDILLWILKEKVYIKRFDSLDVF